MASRFWVGGAGTWNSSTTTHWASTSGGAGGASVPGSGDTVTFDPNSGAGTVTLNYSPTVSTITTFSNTSVAVDFGANTVTLNATSGTVMVLNAGASITASSATFVVGAASASQRSVAGGGRNIGTLRYTVAASTGTLNLTGSNTLNVDFGAGRTVAFAAGATNTIGTWIGSGTSGSLLNIGSNTPGSTTTLTKASGQVVADYLNVQDSTATGGAVWYAGAHSTNSGNNSGWRFIDPWSATSAQTLPSLTQSAAGTRTVPVFTGASAQTLPSITQAAAGTRTKPTFTGNSAQALPSVTQSAVGTRTVPTFTGAASQTLPVLTQQAAGTRSVPTLAAVAAQLLPALTQQAAGTRTGPQFTATAVQVLPALVASLTGFTGPVPQVPPERTGSLGQEVRMSTHSREPRAGATAREGRTGTLVFEGRND